MLSTNTNKRTLEGHVETIGNVLSNLQEKAYAFGVSYLVYRYLVKILRKLESSHATLRNEKILETSLGRNSNIW